MFNFGPILTIAYRTFPNVQNKLSADYEVQNFGFFLNLLDTGVKRMPKPFRELPIVRARGHRGRGGSAAVPREQTTLMSAIAAEFMSADKLPRRKEDESNAKE